MDSHPKPPRGLADPGALLATAHRTEGGLLVGVVVDDANRRTGVGKLLTEVIASLAAHHGALHLRAELLDGNRAMLALMRRLGPTTTSMEGSVMVLHTRLPAAARRRAA